MKTLVLLLLALALAGCSAKEGDRQAMQPSIALPTAKTLPVGLNEECDCIENHNCAVFEERLGYFEVKNTSCKWTATRNEADCHYEVRFVPGFAAKDGKVEYVPENWDKRKMTARHLDNGSWCVAADRK